MSKLDKLEEWLTLEDAAIHISKKIEEIISVTKLYRSALNGSLKLSVYFVNSAYGVKGELGKVSDTENQLPQRGFDIKEESTVHNIKGIWDLTMQGQEALEVKGYFEQSNSGLEVTTRSKNGILLQQDGVTCQLYKPFDRDRIFNPEYNESEERRRAIAEHPMKAWENHPMIVTPLIRMGKFGLEYVPCNKLSEVACVLIIKSSEIDHFIQLLEDTPQEDKPTEQTAYKKNTDKLEQRKAKTQAKYEKWQDEADKIKEENPSKPETWIADKIAKMSIAEGRSSGRIRRVINIK